DKDAPKVLLRVLIEGENYADILFAQLLLDFRGDLAGKRGTVGRHSHAELIEFAGRDVESFQTLGIHKKDRVAAKLRRLHQARAKLAADGQGPVGLIQLENDLVADVQLKKLAG